MPNAVQIQEIHDRNLRTYQEEGDREGIKRITTAIRKEEKRLREKYSILNHQDALGVAWFALAAGGFIASAALYIAGVIPAIACIVISAICASVIRELEHDLIHDLYFKKQPLARKLMMAAVWPFLGNIPNPWYRRKVHLLHHRTSGQHDDVEERFIGNGMKWSFLRVLTTFDAGLAAIFRQKELDEIPDYSNREVLKNSFPVVLVYYIIFYGFLLSHGVMLTLAACGLTVNSPAWLASTMSILNVAMVVYALPNWVRQISVATLSSNMHYFGNVNNRLHETQVLNAWYFFPLQLFSFNFGSTHGIHHFATNQPFYLRQMVAKVAHKAMRAEGMIFNDMGTFLRGNRREEALLTQEAA